MSKIKLKRRKKTTLYESNILDSSGKPLTLQAAARMETLGQQVAGMTNTIESLREERRKLSQELQTFMEIKRVNEFRVTFRTDINTLDTFLLSLVSDSRVVPVQRFMERLIRTSLKRYGLLLEKRRSIAGDLSEKLASMLRKDSVLLGPSSKIPWVKQILTTKEVKEHVRVTKVNDAT